MIEQSRQQQGFSVMAALSFFLMSSCMHPAGVVAEIPAYYVSPAPVGSDSNAGTRNAPFLTLEKAQAAMRSSSIKTTFLLGGTYLRSTTLTLDSKDSGQTWLGFPDQTPVMDGQDGVKTAISISGGKNITLRWLTIQNFTENGIIAGATDNLFIDSNTIKHITSPEWNMGAVRFTGYGTFTNVKITHNFIQDLGYNGISVHAVASSDISNLVIENNIVYDYMKQKADGGGIYVMDRGHKGNPVRIANNIVGNFGTPQTGSKHIYLDDMVSNVTVENNICFGACQWAVQYHGGDRNVVRNNIFDISLAGKMALYQDNPSNGDYGMADNSFTGNIIYSSGKVPTQLWDCWKAATDALPTVSGNNYWNANGTTMPNTGSIVDQSPLKKDPGFVDAAHHDYRFDKDSPSTAGPLPNTR